MPKFLNYEITEQGGALILKPKRSLAKLLKSLIFVFFVLVVLIVAVKAAGKDDFLLPFIVVLGAYTVGAVFGALFQYRKNLHSKYPVFEIDERGIKEIWDPTEKTPEKEILWSELKYCSSGRVEVGSRNISTYDVLIFSVGDEKIDAIENVKKIMQNTSDVAFELAKDTETVYIVLEASGSEAVFGRIFNFFTSHNINAAVKEEK